MRDVIQDLDAWLAAGERVAIATVLEVKRSAPRPPGSKMAISSSGEISGAVSGGCVEGAVVEEAERVLGGGEPRLLHYGIADEEAWDVGLPCGGEIAVFVERYESDVQRDFARLARAGGRGALVTVVGGGGRNPVRVGTRLLVTADGRSHGGLGDAGLDARAARLAEEAMWAERAGLHDDAAGALFVDVIAPPPKLIVCGAVDFAGALCRLARAAGWRPYVVDPRGRFATPERFPEAEEIVVAWPGDAFASLGGIDRATYIAVLTHDPKLDDAALHVALNSEAAYVGAMGSRRMQARRRERLIAGGLTEDALDRLSAPIGLDLGALTAEETALSIMAEIVAVRNGRTGGRLRDASGRIHEVTEREAAA